MCVQETTIHTSITKTIADFKKSHQDVWPILLHSVQGLIPVPDTRLDRKIRRALKDMGQAFQHHGIRIGEHKINAHE
jgi:hypothetical protein